MSARCTKDTIRSVGGMLARCVAWMAVVGCCGIASSAQSGKEIDIDWSQSGVGEMPARTAICAHLVPPAGDMEINAALQACPAGQAVLLAPGTYGVSGTIRVPSHVTLRGAGADQTVLDARGAGEAVVALGHGSVAFAPRVIASGAAAGATQLELGTAQGIASGMYLVITERNDGVSVTSAGSGGLCKWCDGGWTKDGGLARGQIVMVTGVAGNRVTFSPGLYGAYTHAPLAVPFTAAAERAGVEDLQVKANKTGYEANFQLMLCGSCWLKGVASNYADGDHVSVQWGYRDEIRDSYFSNAFTHVPGDHEGDIDLELKTSATVVVNNIIDRTHVAVMLEWGAAANVIAYNYATGAFDSEASNVVTGGIDFHGAHPQFNLIEGNVLPMIFADSVWGSSSQTTALRNWITGTTRVCMPLTGRGTVDCSGAHGHFAFQAPRAVQLSYLATRSRFVGNVIGSAAMQSLTAYDRQVPQAEAIEYPAERPYELAAGFSFGYGSTSDDGRGTGCGGGTPPCHAEGTSRSDVLDGNYSNLTRTTRWASGSSHRLPPSLYQSGKPNWWGSLPFPAIGPDVVGGSGPGGHVYGNPAQRCYQGVMGGSDGGAGSPLAFRAERCYENRRGAAAR